MPRKAAPKTQVHLTADERETIILMDDATGIAKISTHQKKIYTKLKNNPLAKLIEDLTFGATVGGMFEIDANLISFRKVQKAPLKLDAKQEAKRKASARAAGKARKARRDKA